MQLPRTAIVTRDRCPFCGMDYRSFSRDGRIWHRSKCAESPHRIDALVTNKRFLADIGKDER